LKTNARTETPVPIPQKEATDNTLQALLEQGIQHSLPSQVEGLMLGTLTHLDAAGQAQVQPENIKEGPFPAQSVVALKLEDVNTVRFVLGFAGGDPHKPIILGRVWTPPAIESANQLADNGSVDLKSAQSDGGKRPRKITLHAEEEIELRCGSSVILLQAGGIQLRGHDITSHAEAGQRIRGGAVKIN